MIQPRQSLVGGLPVYRALPAGRRRTLGPFVFLDQMGPVDLAPGEGLDVPPHPHIGLATVTYLIEGQLLHRDSVGSVQLIRPGELNWMTAGRGIVHSERTPEELRADGSRLFGLQAWVALPQELTEGEPGFAHHDLSELPEHSEAGVQLRLVAGTYGGMTSPVEVASPLVYLDARLDPGATWEVEPHFPELGLYTVEGEVSIEGQSHSPGHLLVLEAGQGTRVQAPHGARLMLLGGAPVDGPRHIWWNFVAPTRERVEQATAAWRAGQFPRVPGETDFVPAPE